MHYAKIKIPIMSPSRGISDEEPIWRPNWTASITWWQKGLSSWSSTKSSWSSLSSAQAHQKKRDCWDFETEKQTWPTRTSLLVCRRPTSPCENLQENIDYENDKCVDNGDKNETTSRGRRKKRKRRWRRGRPRCWRQGVKPGPLACCQNISGSHRGETPHKGDIIFERFWTIVTFSPSIKTIYLWLCTICTNLRAFCSYDMLWKIIYECFQFDLVAINFNLRCVVELAKCSRSDFVWLALFRILALLAAGFFWVFLELFWGVLRTFLDIFWGAFRAWLVWHVASRKKCTHQLCNASPASEAVRPCLPAEIRLPFQIRLCWSIKGTIYHKLAIRFKKETTPVSACMNLKALQPGERKSLLPGSRPARPFIQDPTCLSSIVCCVLCTKC